MYLYSIKVGFSPTFYWRPKPLFVYGSMALLYTIINTTLSTVLTTLSFVFKEKYERA